MGGWQNEFPGFLFLFVKGGGPDAACVWRGDLAVWNDQAPVLQPRATSDCVVKPSVAIEGFV